MLFTGDKGRDQKMIVEINIELETDNDVTAVHATHAAVAERFGHGTNVNAENCAFYVSEDDNGERVPYTRPLNARTGRPHKHADPPCSTQSGGI